MYTRVSSVAPASRSSSPTSIPFRGAQDLRVARNAVRSRLRNAPACMVCSSAFTVVQQRSGRLVCSKLSCAYTQAVQQSDVWRATADRYRLQIEELSGPMEHLSYIPTNDPTADDTGVTDLTQSGVESHIEVHHPVSTATMSCPYPGCTALMSMATIIAMESRNPPTMFHMVFGGDSIGRCNRCRSADAPAYYCGAHYERDHEQHYGSNCDHASPSRLPTGRTSVPASTRSVPAQSAHLMPPASRVPEGSWGNIQISSTAPMACVLPESPARPLPSPFSLPQLDNLTLSSSPLVLPVGIESSCDLSMDSDLPVFDFRLDDDALDGAEIDDWLSGLSGNSGW
jgi:hypothetical protein